MHKLAWLTPDIDLLYNPPDCRCISVPGDLFYLVNGALTLLTQSHNWEEFGSATPDEMSEFFSDVYEDYLMSTCSYIGEVRAFVFTALPDRWLAMDGSSYDEADYPELFAVLPPAFIPPVPGDTFVLPNMAGRSVVGQGSQQGTTFTLGQGIGTVNVTLTTAQLPAHTHEYIPPTFNVDLETPGAPDIQAAGIGTPTQTGSTGNGQPHSNLPPVMPLVWGIYAGR